MSDSAGAGGVFGILLAARPEVADIYQELSDYVANEIDYMDETELSNNPRIRRKFEKRFIQRFKEHGIAIPSGAKLHYSGLEDSRVGDCDCPSEEWVLGFGLFTNPWNYPRMHVSFRRTASWHTWAWSAV